MRIRYALLALVVVLATVAGGFTSAASAAPPSAGVSATISPAQSDDVLNGVFTITEFVINEAGQLVAEGIFTGTVLIDGVVHQITGAASAVIGALQATGPCTILDLDLGAIHLDVLGLVVDLSEVHLTVTGVTGSGKLLGNLLCTVAGLLDGTGGLAAAIDRLLDLINSIVLG
jgi:hypothetical protein